MTRVLWVRRLLKANQLVHKAFGHKSAFRSPYFGWHARMWREAASALGVEYRDLGYGFSELTHGDQRTRFFEQLMMLGDPVTLKLAGNKPLVHRLLRNAGIPVPASLEFTLGEIAAARQFLGAEQSPCVIKPARETGGGNGVTTGVRTHRSLTFAAAYASLYSDHLLIERQIPGDHYRLLYLDGKFLDGVYRPLPTVTGDGRSSVAQLIAAENLRRLAASENHIVKPLPVGLDCRATLQAQGFCLRSIPDNGQRVVVESVSNQAAETAGESVRHRLADELIKDGSKAACAVGARLAGVDIITPDPTVGLVAGGGVVIEVNATPGLFYHYQVCNPDQAALVAEPILRALLGLAEDSVHGNELEFSLVGTA